MPKAGLSGFDWAFVQGSTLVLRLKFSAKNPSLRQYQKNYSVKINSITINKVKGISNHKFDFQLHPNRPIIFVAPNGFGKSSFGTAFASLIPSRLEVADKNLHKNKKDTDYSLNINYTDESGQKNIVADSSKNEINQKFDVFVINNRLVAKAKIADIQGKKIAKPSLEVEKIVLINTVPPEHFFEYDSKIEKGKFSPNEKIVPNIEVLFQNSVLLNEIIENIDFAKFNQKRNSEKLEFIIQSLIEFEGTKEALKTKIESEIYNSIEVEELHKLCQILEKYDYPFTSRNSDLFFTALQIISVANRLSINFRKCIKYNDFLTEKKEFDTILESINPVSDRFKLKTSIQGNSLIIEWPKAHQISNGQRDVLSFIMLLTKARRDFKKENCILIIDEIFDYLDDGNLITFQYFISEFIETMSETKNLFPIILTHLDPSFFNHFCFSKNKLQLCYLKEVNTKTNKELIKLIDKREEEDIKNQLNLHFFHYNPDKSIDLTKEFTTHGLNLDWSTPEKFHKRIFREVRKYLLEPDKSYDPIAVCLGVRLKVEELAFNTLKDEVLQNNFLHNVKKTRNKLAYCEDLGKPIKEIYYLLSIVYNSPLHIRQGMDIEKPLSIKLENSFIKEMIFKIFK